MVMLPVSNFLGIKALEVTYVVEQKIAKWDW
jgi:hypothetical protein